MALSRCLVMMKSDNIKRAENCHLYIRFAPVTAGCHLLTISSWIYERGCAASLWSFC